MLFGGAAAYQINQSLRFRGAQKLQRTPSSNGNRQTYTISCWVKYAVASGESPIWQAAGYDKAAINTNGTHNLVTNSYDGTTRWSYDSTRLLRDPSAWMHFVWVSDTTNATASDRKRLYINGVRATDFTTATNPSQNWSGYWNSTNVHSIGHDGVGNNFYAKFYIAEFHSVDGTALDPSSFGETDPNTGAWIPKKYSGSYGTNGFYLKFDPTATNGIGHDHSGNGNNWTATGFSTLEGNGQYSQYGDNTTTNPSYTWQKAFNGDITSLLEGAQPPDTNGASTTWDTTSPIAFTKLEVLVAAQPNSNGYLTVNGTTIATGTFTKDSVVRAYNITGSITSPLDTITVHKAFSQPTNNGLWLNGVRINDVLLVDYSAAQANDVKSDTPTTNWCTLNPLKKTSASITNGNLDFSIGATDQWLSVGTIGVTSGKWYWETTKTGGSQGSTGIVQENANTNRYVGQGADGWGYLYTGSKVNNATTASYGNSYTTNDVIGVAFDADAGSLYFYKNGVAQNSGTAAYTGLTSGPYFPAVGSYDSSFTCNFGQRAFAYTPPTGYKALNTANLPEPTIKDGGKYFNTVLWTGNGSTQSITGVGFQPEFVWVKHRSTSGSHNLFDAVRGAGKLLVSNSTIAESGNSGDLLGSFNSDGFQVNVSYQGGFGGSTNNLNDTYAGWCWDAGGTGSTNTAGSITSTVSANASAGFSIITYSGNSTNNSTIGHGLGVAPDMIITKVRTGATNEGWPVWHQAFGNTQYVQLNQTNAVATDSNIYGGSNNTAPTSTVYSVGAGGVTNTSGRTYVAYCFSEVASYSKFGSYVGNGSTDGTFVYCGFRPAWIMVKSSSNAYNWAIHDTTRQTYNEDERILEPNTSGAEATNSLWGVDILSNGFKWRNNGEVFNYSGYTYIFAAFAELPFKYSTAR